MAKTLSKNDPKNPIEDDEDEDDDDDVNLYSMVSANNDNNGDDEDDDDEDGDQYQDLNDDSGDDDGCNSKTKKMSKKFKTGKGSKSGTTQPKAVIGKKTVKKKSSGKRKKSTGKGKEKEKAAKSKQLVSRSTNKARKFSSSPNFKLIPFQRETVISSLKKGPQSEDHYDISCLNAPRQSAHTYVENLYYGNCN